MHAVVGQKKCMPLWCEAHFEVKSGKELRCSEHFWTFGCRFAWQAQRILHMAKNEESYATLHYTTLRLQLQPQLHLQIDLQLQYITSLCTTLFIVFLYATLHSITLHNTTLHYTTRPTNTTTTTTTIHYTTLHQVH